MQRLVVSDFGNQIRHIRGYLTKSLLNNINYEFTLPRHCLFSAYLPFFKVRFR